ncbi:MAG: hypothetical protein SGI71_04795 [Verrucomicrobiota bacterium]|nr:hypothetical protein [Verrucomicrobiota bacterium]
MSASASFPALKERSCSHTTPFGFSLPIRRRDMADEPGFSAVHFWRILKKIEERRPRAHRRHFVEVRAGSDGAGKLRKNQ